MTLVNRVSAYFLVALALILPGYSITLYFLVSQQLHRQFEGQLHAALHQLAAAVEVEDDDVKFELSDHAIRLGSEDGLEDIRWVVCDEAGLVVARSQNLSPGTAANDQLLQYAERLQQEHDFGSASLDVGDWRILQQRLAAAHPKPVSERDPLERAVLVVTVGRSPADLNTNLRQVRLLMIVLPAVGWLFAALLGRWYCGHALQPVLTMADDARVMSAALANGSASADKLPVPATNDELAELGTAFNSLLAAVFQSLAQQRRFTGDAAHQLRTPLAALRGQIEVALRRPRSAEEHERTLSVLLEQTTELQQVIEGLLFLARAEGDSVLPPAELIQLEYWLPEFLERWRHEPAYADLKFECEQPAQLHVPPGLLRQLLENLVSNALKYSPHGKPVILRLEKAPGAVVIAVEDQGPGIPANGRQAIFEPFYRTAAARQAGTAGTGLGLAIASRIAIALGGQLSYEAPKGGGSRFVCSFPA